MTSLHRAPTHLTRRSVLAVGALVAVPGAAVIALQARARTSAGETPGADPGRDVPAAAPTATPSPSSSPKIITSGGGPVPFVAGRAMLGAYLDLTNMSEAQAVALRRKQLGRDERILHVFYAWTDALPSGIGWLPAKAYPMISWRGTKHADILDGSHDALIRRNARRLKRFGRPVLLRWGWEMNGDWFEWSGARNGGDADDYVTLWRRLHRIFAGQGVTNVSWVWSPNWNSSPAQSWNRVQRYYPGDDYVDWVGISGYNFYDETPSTLFDPVTSLYGSRKPIILSETAAVRDRARYIRRLRSWVEDTPQVGAVVWFDTDVQDGTDHNFRFDADDAALAAYRAMARSPHFSG